MARPSKAEQRARELYEASGKNLTDWDCLSETEQEPWFSKASSDMEHPPVEPVLDPGKKAAPKIPPAPGTVRKSLASYTTPEGAVQIETPADNRYVIKGFRAPSVFIKARDQRKEAAAHD
jgi:hypothetical protein